MRKYARVREALREQIVEGEFAAGSSIPTWDRLQHRFDVSRSTIRLALRDLKEEGFLRAAGRSGTLVTEAPPHLCGYALVLPHARERREGIFSLFWEALEAEVRDTVQGRHDGHGRVRVFRGVEEDPEAARAFLNEIEAHHYAGLIFGKDSSLLHHPRVEESGVPRVYLGSRPDPQGVPAVYPHTRLFMEKALDRLASAGCRRVAVLTIPSHRRYFGDCVMAAGERGLLTRRWWVHPMSPQHPEGAESWTQLLMSLPADERPDGLVITDDNLAASATTGLLRSGVRGNEDCRTVVLANYPCPPKCMTPVEYLGCESREILEAALDAIDHLRGGDSVPPVTRIEPHFDTPQSHPN
jgi:DNA-binding LacI/PurR family transcriptional regulator